MHNHLGEHIRQFGPPLFADTDSYESAHKKYTTGLWRNTSRREGGLIKEMTNAAIRQQHCNHIRMINEIKSWNGEGEFESSYFAPHITEMRKYLERKTVSPLSGYKYFCMSGNDANKEKLVGNDNIKD